MNKMDMLAEGNRAEMAELIGLETGALLEAQGDENTPFVFGPALQALKAAQRGDFDAPEAGRA